MPAAVSSPRAHSRPFLEVVAHVRVWLLLSALAAPATTMNNLVEISVRWAIYGYLLYCCTLQELCIMGFRETMLGVVVDG